MNKGGHTTRSNPGFTIVEVMIVLAVTGVLFVAAVVYISGRQAKTEFMAGALQMQQQFQQVISDVQNGYYPGTGTFSCTDSNGTVKLTNTNTAQGMNSDCVFAGKVIVMGGSTNSLISSYRVYSLAALRTDASGLPVTSPQTALPVAIVNPVDVTTTTSLPNGLTYVSGGSTALTPASSRYYAVAVMTDFAKVANGSPIGAQTFSLHELTDGGWGTMTNSSDTAQAAVIAKEATDASGYPAANQANFCFASGGTNQSVLITITSGLQVTSSIKSGTLCQ